MINEVKNLLSLCSTRNSKMPPTILYNEGWLLRLVLNWFDQNRTYAHDLEFMGDADWYSEARLYSRFLMNDDLAESHTHADGVIGDFSFNPNTKAGLTLLHQANQFVVIEAKMNSELSKGVTHAPHYNQAARTVACMAETLRLSDVSPDSIAKLAFYVIAPNDQLRKKQSFTTFTNKEHIKETVKARVDQYENREEYKMIQAWYTNWFLPVLNRIDIRCLSWEELIKGFIFHKDYTYGTSLMEFYEKCKKLN